MKIDKKLIKELSEYLDEFKLKLGLDTAST